jgi:integrase
MARKKSERVTLTDRLLKSLANKPAPKGKHYDKRDGAVPGLVVRVSETGRRTFVLLTRFPGKKNPTRRAIGEYPRIGLDAARQEARDWLKLIARGIDPAIEKERRATAENQRQEISFGRVAEDFIKGKLGKERKGAEVARDIRRVFIEGKGLPKELHPWRARPITDITPLDVRAVVKHFAEQDKLYQAHNLLGYARRLFNWAIDQHVYGLQTSPCDRLKAKAIIGSKVPRSRVLRDAEIRAVWAAADETGYPYGHLFKFLLVTGQRKSECAEVQWSEIDLDKRLWVIPAERMKANAAHVVPLSDDAVELLQSVPQFDAGEYVFSSTGGKKPVNGFSKAKQSFDKLVLAKLCKDDAKAKLPAWVLHDLRRTCRTGLSAIPSISDHVRELVIGHTKSGLHKVYDQHSFLDEKRIALEAWAQRLNSIVTPPPENVEVVTSLRPKAVSVRAIPLEGVEAERPRATFAERATWLARVSK